MKILFFIDSLLCGGKERRVTELMKGLRLRPGIDFEIVVMNENIHYKEVFELGINVHYILRGTKKDTSVFRKFYKICKEYKPDIVHCWDSMTAVYSVLACRRLHIPLINSMVVDTPVQQNILNKNILRARLTFPFSKLIIGNSQAGIAAYRSPKRKSICIYNGFNFDRSKKLAEPETLKNLLNISGKKVIGMVAAFEERKDYATLINTAKEMLKESREYAFLFLGEGDFKESMMQLVPDEFKNNILFLGKIDDVESHVNIFDVAVLCTNTKVHKEGISNSILEYMALGKPVIATSGGGTNEIIQDGKTGFIIDAFDAADLKAKIQILLNDSELSNKMGIAGKSRIEAEFSIEAMINGYVKVYKDIASKTRK